MTLPTAAPLALPAPAPLALPAPSLPTFGMSIADRMLASQYPPANAAFAGAPTPYGGFSTSAGAYSSEMAGLSRLTGGTITAGNDPRTWSPDDAAAQTDRALARIGTVNPELAKNLAEAHGLTQEQGGGFFDTLMGGIGSFFEVTHLDDVFELISRPAKVLPEIIMDWGEESVWKNAADAMAGHSEVSWDDVLVEKLGMERNWFTAAVGFVGDVALDPLTYIPLGRLAGIGREIVGQTAGKAVVSAAIEQADNIGQVIAREGVEAATKKFGAEAITKNADINAMWEVMKEAGVTTYDQAAGQVFKKIDTASQAVEQTTIWSRLKRLTEGVDPDAQGGLVNLVASSDAEKGLTQLVGMADMAVKEATTGNFAKASADLMKKLGVDKAAADATLKRWVSEGTGLMRGGAGKGLYFRGKAAAANLGGWRFHLNIPVLGLRLAPQRILPKFIPQLDFSLARRFSAGIMGQMKLERMVASGAAPVTAMKAFWEGGYKLLKDVHPDVAHKLAGGHFNNVGSVFMETSQAVGRLTAHFSPHAQMLRGGGLYAKVAADARRYGPAMEDSLIGEMHHIVREDGVTVLNPRSSAETITKAFNLGKLDQAAKDTVGENLDEWSRLLPAELGAGYNVDELLAKLPASVRATSEPRVRELQEWFLAQGEGALEAANIQRQIGHNARGLTNAHGVSPDIDAAGYDSKSDLRPEDALRASEEASPHFADTVWESAGDDAWLDSEIIDEDALVDASTHGVVARGIHLKKSATGIIDSGDGNARVNLQTAQREVQEAEAKFRGTQLEGGVFVGDAQAAVAARESAFAELTAAQSRVSQLTDARSRRTVVTAKNPFTLDLRSGAKGAVGETQPGYATNLPRDLATRYKSVVDELQGKMDDIGEGAAPEVKKAAQSAVDQLDTTAAVVSKDLQMEGFDSIRIVVDDGEELIVFRRESDGLIPVSRITEDAGHTAFGTGNTLRAATDEAYSAVRNSKALRDLPGGSERWLDAQIRRFANKPLREAEEGLQQAMRDEGVGLLESQRVLMADPLKAIDMATRRAARQVKGKLMGQSARGLETLGLGGSVLNGGVIGINRYQYVLPGPMLDRIDRIKAWGEEATVASERAALLQKQQLTELKKVAQDAQAQLQSHYARVRSSMDALSARDYGALSGEANLASAVDSSVDARFRKAMVDGDVTELDSNTHRFVDDNGDVVYVSTRMEEGAPGTKPIPDGFVRAYHITDEANLEGPDGIKAKGIVSSAKTAGDDEVVYGATALSSVQARHILDGTLPEGKVVIEFHSPVGRLTGLRRGESVESLEKTSQSIMRRPPVSPEEFVAIHRPGKPLRTVNGVRRVRPDGTVTTSITEAGRGDALMRQHWNDAGAFEGGDDMASAADAIAKQLKVDAKAKTDELLANVGAAERGIEGGNLEFQEAIQEVNRLQTKMTTEGALVKPALVSVDDTALSSAGFERLNIPGFETLSMPTFMAQEFRSAIDGFGGLEGVHAQFRKFNSWWKSHATWMWPGFHVRNMYGAFFNNMLGGVDISDYVMAGRVRFAAREMDAGVGGKWATMRVIDKDPDLLSAMRREGQLAMNGKAIDDLTYGDLASITGSSGVTAGNGRAFGEARVMAADAERQAKPGLIERSAGTKYYAKLARGTGTMTENVMRTAGWLRGMKTYGNVSEARAFTMMRHGDYSDMTDMEFRTVRDLIPFYKWMRTNTPFQIHQMLESPAKLLAVAKAQNAVFTAQGMDYDEEKYKMPSWMGDQFVIPTSGPDDDGAYQSVMLDLPMSDLHTGARDFVSSFLPMVRPLLENYVYDQNTFTGAPLTGEKVPLAGVFNVPGVRDFLDVVGFAEKGDDGQLYTTDKNQNLLGIIPAFSRFKDWMYADPSRTKLRMYSLMSAGMGLSMRPVDRDAMASNELDFYYSQVLPALDHLREMGYPLPTTGDIEANLGSIEASLTALGIEARPGTQSTSEAALSGLPTALS